MLGQLETRAKLNLVAQADLLPNESSEKIARGKRDNTSPEIAQLTLAMTKGNEDAYAEFFKLYFHRLLALSLIQTRGDEHAAQDLVQQCFVKLVRYIHPFDSEEHFRNWLACIVRNCAADERRKSARQWNLLARFWRDRELRDSQFAGAQAVELDERLESTLNSLNQEDRALLEQKYLQGLSVGEIAEASGVSEKAIESRLSRLRAKIRQQWLN